MATVALTGGGTAGHIMPCIAVAEELAKHFDRIIYFGGDGMEKEIVPSYGLPLYTTAVAKFSRREILGNFKIPFILAGAAKEAKDILRRENVQILFAKGGYATLPSALGARSLGIPVVIHESDYTMGMANRFISTFAAMTLTSFPETKGGEYVGNPIRREIFEGDAARARKRYGLHASRPVLLVFGGSSGSLKINEALFGCLRSLTTVYDVVHVTGKAEKERLYIEHYKAVPYAEDIADLYAVADVIVMRAGANSLAEAAALGKRVIAIPLPKSEVSRGDQVLNAQSYYRRGAIDLLPQEELTPGELEKRIVKIAALAPPKPAGANAAEKIVGRMLALLQARRQNDGRRA